MFSCAAQKSMKITLEKKIRNACFSLAPVRFYSNLSTLLKTKEISDACLFLAPVQFHSNLLTLLKTLISFDKYDYYLEKSCFLAPCKKA